MGERYHNSSFFHSHNLHVIDFRVVIFSFISQCCIILLLYISIDT